MSHIARSPVERLHTARDLAVQCHLPVPTVSKILKALLEGGLVDSHRGMKGGYTLAREPHLISIAAVIAALEGPLALTEWSPGIAGHWVLDASARNQSQRMII